ncbi:hypothetical protein M378DRAFT_163556 [Amanita muscaria Koide BX008]|uniref:FHA domain-containing protein n=1 Tax=Amanita muscaria (strain Koide BX008) TaxID=946122 RepID=A0A0C2X5T7_AMAMK|nr:hypothetical protein M378DRAFT_163556 [Amanita muscaria Koide BX008]
MTDSFPFDPKRVLLPPGSHILLGSAKCDSIIDEERSALPSNGFFSAKFSPIKGGEPIIPLALSADHAEIWVKNNQLMLRDLETPFGTFVNGTRIIGEHILKSGDVISLGYKLSRNDKTPAHVADDHLRPVIAKVIYSVTS